MGMIARAETRLKDAKETLEFWNEILQAAEELLDIYHPDWQKALRKVQHWEREVDWAEVDMVDARKACRLHANGVETKITYYSYSGIIESCTSCNMEDHTGDISWDLHVCDQQRGQAKVTETPTGWLVTWEEDGDIPF